MAYLPKTAGYFYLKQTRCNILLYALNIQRKFFLSSKFVLIVYFFFFHHDSTGRVKEVLNDFYLAITNEEDEKPNNVMDELKTNAAELMKELETKRGK